jgi:electron transfer flavoprotein alpha subunit
MGPPQARDALVEALAMGADEAIHLLDRAFAGADTLATSRALSRAIQRVGYDVIFCGRYSVDAETGQVGPEVAEILGIPHVSGLRRLEVAADGTSFTAERETDVGYQVYEGRFPVLFTTAERLNKPIRVTPEQVAAKREAPVAVWTARDLSEDPAIFGLAGSPTWVAEIRHQPATRRVQMIGGQTPGEQVQQLVRLLDERGVFDGRRQAPAHSAGARVNRPLPGKAVWVLAEMAGEQLRPVTFELLGAARALVQRLQGEVAAILLGPSGVRRHASALAQYGADRVYLAEDEALAPWRYDAIVATLAGAIATHRPYAILIPSTADGRDVAPRLAARLGLGLTGDCVGLEIDDEGRLVQIKPAFGGNIVAPILSRTMPQMATIRPGALEALAPDPHATVRIEPLSIPPIARQKPALRLLSEHEEAGNQALRLDHTRVIVCVGMGIGGPENLSVMRELADALGGTLGATRKVVDQGWLPRQYQIGLTGHYVAPDLYIAVGVRGSFNHTIGMQRARTVVAINSDPQAEIFQHADYGIVAPWQDIVPLLTSALHERRKTA